MRMYVASSKYINGGFKDVISILVCVPVIVHARMCVCMDAASSKHLLACASMIVYVCTSMYVHMDWALANHADVGFKGAVLYAGVCVYDCICA